MLFQSIVIIVFCLLRVTKCVPSNNILTNLQFATFNLLFDLFSNGFILFSHLSKVCSMFKCGSAILVLLKRLSNAVQIFPPICAI